MMSTQRPFSIEEQVRCVLNFVRLADSGNDEYAAYLFLDGKGYSGVSIKYVDGAGMHELAIVDDDSWHDIKIVGNTVSDTFDFHLDGALESSGNPFYEDVDDIANLCVGSDTYSGGAYQIWIDDVKLTAVPDPGAICLLAPGLVALMRFRRNGRR